jgi:retron-type reverse transcriptase
VYKRKNLEMAWEKVKANRGDDANYGYRRGRSTKDALRKVWNEIDSGSEWIVDAA